MHCRVTPDAPPDELLAQRVATSMDRVRADLAGQILDLTVQLDAAQVDYERAFARERAEWGKREGSERWREAMDAVDVAYAVLQRLAGRVGELERRMHRLAERGEFDRRLAAARRLEDLHAKAREHGNA